MPQNNKFENEQRNKIGENVLAAFKGNLDWFNELIIQAGYIHPKSQLKSIEQQIEELAELQFSKEEIGIVVDKLTDEIDTTYKINYDRGRLKAQAAVRAQIYKLAIQGSTPAQKQFQEYVDQANFVN